jgi:hypothetical protein
MGQHQKQFKSWKLVGLSGTMIVTNIVTMITMISVAHGARHSASHQRKPTQYTTSRSLPKAIAEFSVFRLFQIQAGEIQIASTQLSAGMNSDFLKRALQIRFRRDLNIRQGEVLSLGASCSLRPEQDLNRPLNFISSSLPRRAALKIETGTEFLVQQVQTAAGRIRATLIASHNADASFELFCQHPQLENWTVTSFEIHNQNQFEIRTNIQRDPANLSHSYGPHLETALRDLKGSKLNAWFGSGLPGQHGIQLLIGTELRAFASNGNHQLWVGQKCAVLSLVSSELSGTYQKDSKYAFVGRQVDHEAQTVRFRFQNWGYELDTIEVECKGPAHEVLTWATAQIEADLNGAIHFYKK